MAKRRSSRSQTATFLPEAVPLKIDQKLVLLQWMLWLFDKKSFEQLAEPFKLASAGARQCATIQTRRMGWPRYEQWNSKRMIRHWRFCTVFKVTSSIRPPRPYCAVSRPKRSRDNRWASRGAAYQMRCMNYSCWVVAKTDRRRKSLTEMQAELIDWARSYGSASSTDLQLSQAASSSPKVIRFVDRYMKAGRNVLSGYDASEGALYILFLAVLAVHPKAPLFCAVDNADHGLNPGLAKALMENFANWVLGSKHQRQILMTSHNPAVLDGLPLAGTTGFDCFAIDRGNHGKTIVKRIMVNKKLLEMAAQGWTMSRLWMNKLIGGMPDV